MSKSIEPGAVSSPDPCAEWVEGKIREAALRVGREIEPKERSRGRADGDVAILKDLLFASRIDEAEAFCRAAGTQRDGKGTGLGLVLDVIRKLEGEWKSGYLGIGGLTLAFWHVQQLLDRLIGENEAGGTPRLGLGSVLIALPEVEAHQFGARLVAEEFRTSGWNAVADLSASRSGLLNRLNSECHDAVGLSVAYDGALAGLADLMQEIRRASANPKIKVMIGGAAIEMDSRSYDFLGADFVGSSVRDAMDFLFRTQGPPSLSVRN